MEGPELLGCFMYCSGCRKWKKIWSIGRTGCYCKECFQIEIDREAIRLSLHTKFREIVEIRKTQIERN